MIIIIDMNGLIEQQEINKWRFVSDSDSDNKIMNREERESIKQNSSSSWQRRHNNQKFLSIKSVVRNKRLVVKKSLSPDKFNYSMIDSASFIQQSEPLKQPVHKHNTFHGNNTNTNTNTNVVNIQFFRNMSDTQRIQKRQYRAKKRIGQSYREKAIAAASFSETIHLQPYHYRNPDGCFSNLDRKKNQHYGTNKKIISKANANGNGNEQQIFTNRTLHELQPVGKQIFLTTTAHTNKSEKSRKKPNEKKSIENSYDIDDWSYRRRCETPPLMSRKKEKKTMLESQKQFQQQKQNQRLYAEILKQFKDFMPLRRPVVKKDHFIFSMSEKPVQESDNKIQLYRDFLWKINFSNCLYVHTPEIIQNPYKVYVGYGNNSCMIKSILKRRPWWIIVQGPVTSVNLQQMNFVWTQLKINSIFKSQTNQEAPKFQYVNSEMHERYISIKGASTQNEQKLQIQQAHTKIFNAIDWMKFQRFTEKNPKTEAKVNENSYTKRLQLYARKDISKHMVSSKFKVHNHLEFNYYLGNKKGLFYNIKRLCRAQGIDPFLYIPMTYHISKGIDDPVYHQFLKHHAKLEDVKKKDKGFRNIWIAKPGQNSNRGNGISVCFGIDDVKHRLRGKEKNSDGKLRTFILQKYIERPFLYKNRKFDIRHYILLTCINGRMKAYWFKQGYIRTSSSSFNLINSKDVLVHLTNDAVQKKSQMYGKHEKGNKVSYEDFQKYLDSNYKKRGFDFLGTTLNRMKEITLMAIEATYLYLDPNRRQNNFELIGLDFMIDENFDPWLIEANTNPCLELSCPMLEKLIPCIIQQLFRIVIDPLFPPPESFQSKRQFYGQNPTLENRFELIFDEVVNGKKIEALLEMETQKDMEQLTKELNRIEQDDETFEDDGNDKWEEEN